MLMNVTVAQSGEYYCQLYHNKDMEFHQSTFVLIQDKPSHPILIHAQALSESSLNVSWTAGANQNSPISLHSVYLHDENGLVLQKNVSFPLSGTTLHNLKPYTCYTLFIRALNDVGWSDFSNPEHLLTLPGLPVAHPTVHVINVSSHSIFIGVENTNLKGVNPDNAKRCSSQDTRFATSLLGPLTAYTVTVATMQPYKLISKEQHHASTSYPQVLVISPLNPFTRYNLSFAFYNGRFVGPSSSLVVSTTEGIPDKPKIINSRSSSNSVVINWENETVTVGKIIAYKVELHTCPGNDTVISKRLKAVQLNATSQHFAFENLDPSTCYVVHLASATKAGFSTFSKIEVQTESNAPSPPFVVGASFLETNEILVNWTCTNECSSVLKNPRFSVCWYFHLFPSEKKCLPTQTSNKMKSAYCYCDEQEKFQWTTFPSSSIFDEAKSGRIIFTVRSSIPRINCADYQQDCEIQSDDSNIVILDLLSSPSHRRLQTTRKYDFNVTIAAIVSFTLLIFFCVIIAACFANRVHCFTVMCLTGASCYRKADVPAKYRRVTPFRLSKTNHKAISSAEFRDHVNTCHADDDAGFQAEFESLEQNVQNDWPTSVARSPENIAKNRYSNILAYDHSRVVLKETGTKSDYINANYVDGYHRRAAYIAAQGPIPSTFDDFWLMVWEQMSNVIVMISNFVERGRRKCDKYWPSSGQQTYGNISVRIVSEVVRAFYTFRVFSIRNIKAKRSSKDRFVYHYQYTDWRDFDVPPSPLPVLKFVEASITHWTLEKGPIVVHCSAGVGRTGTYICIESLIRQLKVEKAVSVRGFLEHIRQQRMKLVQTEQQYAFIHDALCEYILYPCHSIHPLHFSDYVRHLYELDQAGVSNLKKQFDMCMDFGYNSIGGSTNSGNSIVDQMKLPISTGISDSLGIDFSILHGFLNVCEYIVIRHPLGNNITDFWKKVWDANSSLIVCLSDESLLPFWPDETEQTRTIGWLHINFTRKEQCSDSLVRFQFLLTSDREDYALPFTLWQFNRWPSVELENPQESRIASELLVLATRLTQDNLKFPSSPAPIVLVDETGGYRVGTFCAIRILISQFMDDFLLDVYFVFKMLCLQRPHIFRGYWDLEFIYTLMQYYLKNELSSSWCSNITTTTTDPRYGTLSYLLEGRNTTATTNNHPGSRISPVAIGDGGGSGDGVGENTSPKRILGQLFFNRRRFTHSSKCKYHCLTNNDNNNNNIPLLLNGSTKYHHHHQINKTAINSLLHDNDEDECNMNSNHHNHNITNSIDGPLTDAYHREESLVVDKHHYNSNVRTIEPPSSYCCDGIQSRKKHQSVEFLSFQTNHPSHIPKQVPNHYHHHAEYPTL
ncbi:unnamed protein product [Trichobilharzia szidati]|nr:unnamed protein product [Trichobilharzia szidati]